MDWSSIASRRIPSSRRSEARRARNSRPTLETMEGRQLLSTMAASYDGISGTSGGTLWHYQQDGGWVSPGGFGIAQLANSKDQFGSDEVFARLTDNSIWRYNFATTQWKNTGGSSADMSVASNGINAVSDGGLWHYQDNGGWTKLGGLSVASIIDSKNPYHREEVFVRLGDSAVWSYTMASGQWRDTGGHVDTMVGAIDGINALAAGSLWHYQDDQGWTNSGGKGLVTLVDSRNQSVQDEVFALAGDKSVWSYTQATNQWVTTGGHLDSMIATTNGIAGITGGYLWRYQDDGGWNWTGGHEVVEVVNAVNQYDEEQLFTRSADSSIRTYSFDTNSWTTTNGYLA